MIGGKVVDGEGGCCYGCYCCYKEEGGSLGGGEVARAVRRELRGGVYGYGKEEGRGSSNDVPGYDEDDLTVA